MVVPPFRPRSRIAFTRRQACVLALFAILLAQHALAQNPLSLTEALDIAERDAPMLAARAAATTAAELQVAPAGELPDPELLLGVDNLPVTGSDAGSVTADFMTMRRIGLMQEFPRRAKRDARIERARADVERARAELTIERLSVRESVAKAWIAASLAERRIALLESLRPRLDAQVVAADAALTAGRGAAAEGLAARAQRSALEDRLAQAGRELIEARAELERWLPDAAQRPLADAPDFGTLEGEPAAFVANVGRHRGLLGFDAQQRAAEAELALAQAEKRPDWALEMSYGKRGPEFSDMLSVAVRIDLPIFAGRRQDPRIAAQRAQLERIDAEREAARREHVAQLRAALAIWRIAGDRVDRYERELLPLAEDRAESALAAYRGGRGDLAASLSALSDLIEQRLAATERLAELGEAWASLRYAFVQER